MLKVTVSGSFHRHMTAITTAVYELTSLGTRVLSPADPRVVDAHGEFLFVASDRVRSVRLVQDRHLEAVRCADFLWLVCPDGYVGQSASMELGFAAGAGIPVYSTTQPSDLTLREYVIQVPSMEDAILRASTCPNRKREGLLIEPHDSIERAHVLLESLRVGLCRPATTDDSATVLRRNLSGIRDVLSLPTYTH